MQLKNLVRKHEATTMKLTQHPAYAESVLRATELAEELREHRQKLATLRMQCARVGPDARQFINNGAMALPTMTSVEFDAIALEAIQSRDVMAQVFAARRSGPIAKFYASLRFQDMPRDLDFVKSLDDERAAVDILERAVKLHGPAVLKQKTAAMIEIAQALKPKREQIARQVAKALMDLRSALAEEQAFGDELAAQDPGFTHQVQPAIFPTEALLRPEILAWIAAAQAAGLMDPTYQPLEIREEARAEARA